MKKLIFLFAILFAVQISFAKKLDLKLNLEKGETYKQIMVSKTKVAQEVMGQKIDILITMHCTSSFKVVDIVDGNFKLEICYDEMSMDMKMPQGNQSFSSESNDESDPLSAVLSKIIGKKFSMTMTEKGKVLEIEGMSELMTSMFDDVEHSNPQIEQMKQQFEQAFGEDAFKNSFEKTTAIYPEGKIKKGAEWESESNQNMGFTINSKSTYKLVDFDKSVANVTGTSLLATPEVSAAIEMGPMKMEYQLSGEMKTNMKIDRKTGWVKEAKMTQKLEGEILMSGDNLPEAMKLPMKMQSDIMITE